MAEVLEDAKSKLALVLSKPADVFSFCCDSVCNIVTVIVT
jgi:hypothetical protein